ncbi:MAG: RyR domain-containing protein [Devosia sp.]
MTERRKPQRNPLPLIIAVLAIAAVTLVVAGRLVDAGQYKGWQDPLYSVLLAFTVDGTFLGAQNPITLLGAFAAALVFYLALLGSLWVVFRRRLIAWRASRSSGHIAIIGDDLDAEELAEALAAKTAIVLLSNRELRARGILSIEAGDSVSDLIAAGNLHRARTIVIMRGDDRENAALATAIAAGGQGKEESEPRPAIWCRIHDRLIADRISAAEPGAGRILVFDQAQMMAREIFARHPAHAIAERMAAPRVHLLVAGFGGLGQAVAEEAIFSGLAHGLRQPMVTILDRDAATAELFYRATRPALHTAADFAFIGAELITLPNAPMLTAHALAELATRDDISPVTAIAICLGSDADNVRIALALPDIRRREGRYFAPAFMRLRDPDAAGIVLTPRNANVVDPNAGVIPLERPTRLMASDILDAAHRDAAARQLHHSYSQRAARSSGASSDWNRLAETYRRANRRSADHIAAKLFSIGLVSEHDAHAPLTVRSADRAAFIEPLLSGPSDAIERLAALEHRRWTADRAIDGWSFAPTRDDDRKHHPLLETGDYSKLPPSEQEKDRQQIRTVLSSVTTAPDASAMSEIRVALAGHRNLAPDEEKRATAILTERLVVKLAQRDRVVTLVSQLAAGGDTALTEAVSTALSGKVGQLRLIVPEAVPYRIVLEVAAAEAGGDEAERSRYIEAAFKRRAALFARFARVDIVRIGFAGKTDDSYRRDSAQFERALARANAYLARRTDLLGVLWDGKPARGMGGTAELVAYWRDPATIPANLDPGPSPRHGTAPRSDDSLAIVTVTR